MKKNRLSKAISLGISGRALTAWLAIATASFASGQQSYTFTSAGATGPTGPTQGQVNTAYASTNLNNSVTVTNGIQYFTIPTTGMYSIRAIGASGASVNVTCANQGGRGADITGNFNLTAGTVLKILVGQVGLTNGSDAGGGGGSFVASTANSPYVVAGGGGGASNNVTSCGNNLAGVNASTNTAGTADASGQAMGGSNGNGGSMAGSASSSSGAGAGFNTNGQVFANTNGAAQAFVNGGSGGLTNGVSNSGGFGGGGTSWSTGGSGGGGGGYSGGGAYGGSPYTGGGGGGSFNGGTAQVNTISATYGDGTVIISDLCDVNVNASSNPICTGDQVTLYTNAGSNIQWSTGPTTQSIVVSPTSNTSYTVSGVSSSSTACSSTLVITVTVNPLPNLSASSQPSVLCVGSTASVYAQGAQSFTWNTSAQGASTTVAPAVTSIYTVTGTGGNGCRNTATVEVDVNTNALSVTPSFSLCEGESKALSASGAISPTTYTWNTTPVQHFNSIIVAPLVTTNYYVMGIDMHNCAISGSVTATVLQRPSITAFPDRATICRHERVLLTAGGGTAYTWNSGATTNTVSMILPADVTYTFSVTGTGPNGCTNTATTAVVVDRCVGVAEVSGPKSTIAPNPTAGEVTVRFGTSGSHTYRLADVTGKLLQQGDAVSDLLTLDLRNHPAGVYYLTIETNGERQVMKVIRD